MSNMKIQRFKSALTTGYWPDNPEDLVRDEHGDYVLYSQVIDAIGGALDDKTNDDVIGNLSDVFGVDFSIIVSEKRERICCES